MLTALVIRDTFLAAVFLWKIPLEAALDISAIATGRAASAAALSPAATVLLLNLQRQQRLPS